MTFLPLLLKSSVLPYAALFLNFSSFFVKNCYSTSILATKACIKAAVLSNVKLLQFILMNS